jgi:hypothetical protein
MDGLLPYLLVDALLLGATFYFLWPQMTFFHPATYYYFYHGYVITLPGWRLYFGAPPMYWGMAGYLPIREDEFARALAYAGVALVGFAIGCYHAHKQTSTGASRSSSGYVLSRSAVFIVVAVCLPLGILAFVFTGGFLDSEESVLLKSGYTTTVGMWPIACLLLCIFRFGFRWFLVLPTVLYLAFVGLQGYHRFMLLLPLLFLGAIYLHHRRLRWPPPWAWAATFIVILVFPQLKYIAQAVHTDSYDMAMEYIKAAVFLPSRVEASREELLDPYAGALTMADRYGKTYYGTTYLAILTLPLPRFMWPEKPGLGDHIISMSTPSRPYDLEGRTISYIAESYMNFGYVGVLLVPLLLGLGLTRWHSLAMAGPPLRADQLLYFCVAVSLLQVYRDGLSSLVVFSVVNNTPIFFAWAIQRATGDDRRVFRVA